MSTTTTLGQPSSESGTKSNKYDPRLVPSGKVYRQLFEAQVQLSDAYDKVKDKYRENPPQIKITETNIPLVTEGRNLRGSGILTAEGQEWLNTYPNESLVQNPIYQKYQAQKQKTKVSKLKKLVEKESVNELPDTVVPGSKGSEIESKIEASRKKKHNETWEDMIQEIALINLNLEPEVAKTGKRLLRELEEDDFEIRNLLDDLNTEDIIINGSSERFKQLKQNLLEHTEIRKRYIENMDKSYLQIEDERVDSIRSIFNQYADKLFMISYLPRPNIERSLDIEIQQLNNQILLNKTSYAQLYAKLITADIERERDQVNLIDNRFGDWRSYALDVESKNLEEFVENLNMLNPEHEKNYEEELGKNQKEINSIRLTLIESLKSLKPPESTKPSIYKWFETFRLHTQRLEETNTQYVNKLQMNYEESNQKIINKMEETLENLISRNIIDETNSKHILENRLLPIWSKKQKKIEEYIQTVETDLEEINQIVDKELNTLFKYLQGICHIWDLHELGLTKKERALQEMLQDCRRDHDNDNQKKEEKLDSILDQMRESSDEKGLKRLLTAVEIQLDTIKKGYLTFKESQQELVKHYPEMVKEELNKYQEGVLKFFSLIPESKLDHRSSASEEDKADQPDSFRNILKEVLSTERGTKFYITLRSSKISNGDSSTHPDDDANSDRILNHDEIIPNTKQGILNDVDSKVYLKYSYIPVDLISEIRDEIRMNFLNHLDTWVEEASVRASTIVAAKSDEIEKELELRLHLHEPRIKRVQMDVHNVRAAELIMHEERVQRHCAGIKQALEDLKKQYDELESSLIEKANHNKSEVLNLEVAFNNATKSLRLINLQDQLNRQRDKHIEEVKTTIRNFRAKLDDTLSHLRNSNAKFRFSFNVFSDGGNFSAAEIELHKKSLEKMALDIDENETLRLKEMEKLEKRHLDEALKVMSQFQDKFKFHLIDLQFIEKISRWLNDTQIKIKTNVNESNVQAKRLNKLIEDFEVRIDACKHPNLDKMQITPKDLLDFFEELNALIYERAFYLKCIKDENLVPIEFRKHILKQQEPEPEPENHLASLAQMIINEGATPMPNTPGMTNGENNKNVLNAISNTNISSATPNQNQTTQSTTFADTTNQAGLKSKSAVSQTKSNAFITPNVLKSGSKVAISEDPALDIIKTILNKNNEGKLSDAKEFAQSLVEQSTTQKTQTTKASKKLSKNSRSSKLSKLSVSSRRAKTRDEMYAYYLTFGEHRNPGIDFMGKITNILRDALEGILTNSEIFYRDLQQNNRQITRRASLKDSYPEFAEAIISKLKSYQVQCEVYQNQCLKEFRETVTKYEILTSKVPELVVREIFVNNQNRLESDLKKIKTLNFAKLNRLDDERKKNETTLRPSLGHPNMLAKLEQLNDSETKRQDVNSQTINSFTNELNTTIKKNTDHFLKDLSKTNENLLIKFDELLCVDDIHKNETIPEKHPTNELIKRHLAGVSLEDPEPEPLIKREKGKWKGIENFEFFKDEKETKKTFSASSINTAKTTLPHQTSSFSCQLYYEKFKKIAEENLKYVQSIQGEFIIKENKWSAYWANSIKEIKGLYN